MPYSGPDDEKLPENVQALPEAMRAQWVEVWNTVFDDCMEEDGDTDACESRAFRQANGTLEEDAEAAEGFIFVELQTDAENPAREIGVREVEILRTGTFVDRHGQELEITEADLDAFVRNFDGGVAGQDIPFDVDHERKEAAGWLQGLRRAGDILIGSVTWSTLGKQLIMGNIYRYLSATIDVARKVIRAISLVNFPAVKGLAPLELSEGVWTYQYELEDVMDGKGDVNLDEVRTEVRAQVLAELEAERKQVAELRAQVRQEMEAELRAEFERRQAIVEFAEKVTTGNVQLAVKADDLVALMEQLPDDEALTAFKDILEAKVVALSEIGSSGDGQPNKKKLPEEYAAQLRQGTLEIADLRNPVLGLGDLGDYDLSEFDKS